MTNRAEQPYKSGRALEMAVKEKARQSEQDTNRAIDDFYVGRLLERVFSQDEPQFVLKGGRSVLARTINARYTRDTDFLYKGENISEAVGELKKLASLDLGDHLEFLFKSMEQITQDQEYREGFRLTFKIMLDGTRPKGEATVDLVVDQVPSDDIERITPANRLDINGLPTFDYYVCPAAYAIADKVCATLQLYAGRESSRIRDLVDLVVYLTTEELEGRRLSERIHHEAKARHLVLPAEFRIPRTWHDGTYSKTHVKQAKEAKLPNEYHDIHSAELLVKTWCRPRHQRTGRQMLLESKRAYMAIARLCIQQPLIRHLGMLTNTGARHDMRGA